MMTHERFNKQSALGTSMDAYGVPMSFTHSNVGKPDFPDNHKELKSTQASGALTQRDMSLKYLREGSSKSVGLTLMTRSSVYSRLRNSTLYPTYSKGQNYQRSGRESFKSLYL